MIGMSAQAECVRYFFAARPNNRRAAQSSHPFERRKQEPNREHGNQSIPFCKLFLNSDEVTL